MERRRLRRTIVITASFAVLGVAVGLALPRNPTAAVVLFVAALCCVGLVAMRVESIAPLHGLHRVVRLPLRRSISATCASFSSRTAGSARALVGNLRPAPTPLLLDEPDEEAASWWGPKFVPPPTTEDTVAPYELPTPAEPEPEVPAPVLAAPLPSARVPEDATGIGYRVGMVWSGARRHVGSLTKRRKESVDGAGAST